MPGCDVPNHYPKRHTFDYHVPNLFNEDLDVQDVTFRRLAALKLADVWLLGMRATIFELTRYEDSMGLLSGDANREITANQSTAMRALCGEMCIVPPEMFTLYQLNSPASLFHCSLNLYSQTPIIAIFTWTGAEITTTLARQLLYPTLCQSQS